MNYNVIYELFSKLEGPKNMYNYLIWEPILKEFKTTPGKLVVEQEATESTELLGDYDYSNGKEYRKTKTTEELKEKKYGYAYINDNKSQIGLILTCDDNWTNLLQMVFTTTENGYYCLIMTSTAEEVLGYYYDNNALDFIKDFYNKEDNSIITPGDFSQLGILPDNYISFKEKDIYSKDSIISRLGKNEDVAKNQQKINK